ncbi:MAG TPA: CRISPR-associated endonuclease Cas1 [Flavilitoribacter sp.]|nr:CRISPR-associated endonuclease Cas1 [Flavilitoribacter sp.]
MQLHLNSYGAYLHVREDMFEVQVRAEGETRKTQVAAHKVKSIWLSTGTALSSDAVKLAVRNNIDIVFLENNGTPIGRVWHAKLGSTTLIRKRQLEASLGEAALHYTKQWVGAKMDNQIALVESLRKHRPQHLGYLDFQLESMAVLRRQVAEIRARHVDDVADSIRGWEGTCGRLYFETLSFVLPQQYQFGGRSFRPAKDPFNAFLNYAYGVLYSRVEKALMLAGADPFVGFLHRDDYNYKSMVNDFIEPFRGYADKVVFSLFSAKKIRQDHTDPVTGGVSLNKEGKALLMEHFNQYLEEEKVRYKGRQQSRAATIQFDAHQFAAELIGKSSPQ